MTLLSSLYQPAVPRSGWSTIQTSRYTATPASTSVVTMSDTSDFIVGDGLKYTDASGTFYAIVTAISANTNITIAGAPLDTGDDLTALYVGYNKIDQADFFVSGTYGDEVADLLAPDMNTYFKSQDATKYLVSFSVVHKTVDGDTQPKVNVKVNGSVVSTTDSSKGIQLSTSGTWVDNSAVAIDTATYDLNRGEAIEVNCTEAGGDGDAANLTVSCIFVNI